MHMTSIRVWSCKYETLKLPCHERPLFTRWSLPLFVACLSHVCKISFWVQMSQNHKTYPCHVDWIWTIALLRFLLTIATMPLLEAFPSGKIQLENLEKTIHSLAESLQKIQARKQHLTIFYCCNTRTFNTWVSWSISKRQNSRASAPTTEYHFCWSSRQQISSSLQLSRDFGGFLLGLLEHEIC